MGRPPQVGMGEDGHDDEGVAGDGEDGQQGQGEDLMAKYLSQDNSKTNPIVMQFFFSVELSNCQNQVFHFSSWRIYFFTAIITIVVSGCSLTQAKRAVLPVEKTLTPAEKLFSDRRHELAAIPNWSFTGRVAVQRDAEGWSATMH